MMAQRYYVQCLIWIDRAQDPLDHFDRIREISPKDPEMLRMDVRRAEANLCLRNFEEAKEYGKISASHPITTWPSYTVLISTLGHLGELSEVNNILEKMRNRIVSTPEFDCTPEDIMNFNFVKKTLPFLDNNFAEIYLTGLRKASFPD